MTGPVQYMLHGWSRLQRVRRLVAWLWLANILFALPLAALVASGVARSIRSSRIAEILLEGLDLVWHSEYAASTTGVAGSLSPSQVGVGAFLDNVELWFSGRMFELEPGLVAAGVLYGALWAFLLGGTLACLQSGERPSLRRFSGFCGEFFGRFLRLVAVMAVPYYLVYRLSGWLFGSIEEWTRDVTQERSVLALYLLAAALIVLLLIVLRMISDYAKIAMVMEDRRSALFAAARGASFVVGRPIRALALVAIAGAIGLLMLYAYHLVAPGTSQASWTAVGAAFALGQLFLIARLSLRLTLLGAELDLYEKTSSFGGTVQES